MRHWAETRMTAPCRARRQEQGTGAEGTSALEFALVLPVLLAMCLGLVEFGNMFTVRAAMDKAAQVGVRTAVTGKGIDDGSRESLVEQAALNIALPAAGTQSVTVTIRSWPTASATGTPQDGTAGKPCSMVEVEVRCDYRPITPIVGDMLPLVIPLTGQGRGVNEPWVPCG